MSLASLRRSSLRPSWVSSTHWGEARQPGSGLFTAGRGRPVEAERWAHVVDRWQYRDAALSADPHTEARAAVLRALLCRRGIEQMRADADEAARKFAAVNRPEAMAQFYQGLARVLSGVTPASSVFIIAPVALVAAGRSISCAAERRVVASLRPEPSPATSEPSKPGERSTALRITRVHEALDRAHHAGRVFGDCGDIRCGRTGWQVRYRVLERGH